MNQRFMCALNVSSIACSPAVPHYYPIHSGGIRNPNESGIHWSCERYDVHMERRTEGDVPPRFRIIILQIQGDQE